MNSTARRNRDLANRLSNNLARLVTEFAKDYNSRVLIAIHAQGYEDIRASHSAVFNNLGLGAVRVTELAERAQVTQQAMGKMLKELERLGYVARDIDDVDRRAKVIRLTERGVDFIRSCMEVTERVRADYATLIGAEQLAQLEVLMQDSMRKINLTYLPEHWLD